MTNYPKGIKAFYMKLNPDDLTVAAMDILVPKIGELIGGSQRYTATVIYMHMMYQTVEYIFIYLLTLYL